MGHHGHGHAHDDCDDDDDCCDHHDHGHPHAHDHGNHHERHEHGHDHGHEHGHGHEHKHDDKREHEHEHGHGHGHGHGRGGEHTSGHVAVPVAKLQRSALDHEHSMVTSAYRVRNVCCEAEVRLVHVLLDPMPGVQSTDINIVSRTMYVQHCSDTHCLAPDTITSALNHANLGASLISAGGVADGDAAPTTLLQRVRAHAAVLHALLLWLLFVAGAALHIASGGGLGSEHGVGGGADAEALHVTALVVLCACAVVGALPMLVEMLREWIGLRVIRLEMRFLMLIAIGGAIALGEWIEAGLLVALWASAKLVERCARAPSAPRSRVRAAPLCARPRARARQPASAPPSPL